jgi:hypothetical protein
MCNKTFKLQFKDILQQNSRGLEVVLVERPYVKLWTPRISEKISPSAILLDY